MKDEIKEILDKLNNMIIFDENLIGWQIDGNGTTISKKDFKTLLDCITNLQEEVKETADLCSKHFVKIQTLKEENERLKEENKRIFSKVNDDELLISNAMNYAEAQDYKSRCEKATKLLKQAGSYDEETKQFCDDVWEELLDILNVLEGSDK